MTTLGDVLRTYAPEVSADEYIGELAAAFERANGVAGDSLTAGEATFLADHGGKDAADVLAHWDSAAEASRQAAAARAGVDHVYVSTMSAQQAADQTGKSRSQITRDITGGRLYALMVGRGWRIPRWQFTGGQPLPGLAVVVPALPHHLHPTLIEGFMTTPQDELGGRTPIAYLVTGGSPAVVAEAVSGLNR